MPNPESLLDPDTLTRRLAAVDDEVHRESDRASVILAVAELDESLRALLETFFLPPNSTSKKYGMTLFRNDEAAGTLSARIELAYRVGLIPSWCQYEAHVLRRIRNEFAHQPAGYTFASAPVRDLLQLLQVPVRIRAASRKGDFPRNYWRKPKHVFAISALCVAAEIGATRGNVQDGHIKRPRVCRRRITFGTNGETLE